ncbi:hypothetical protein BDW59DRAFT_35092 [Aspergillus cavernicola]|uniref:Ankyrin repeat-containing domain protein n=1 Tax=Aspergillus cavernicola TaxID=176166 RepID=A0ABR4HC86_9EURO
MDMRIRDPRSVAVGAILRNESVEKPDPSTIWAADGLWEYRVLPNALPSTAYDRTARYFSWYATGLPQGSSDVTKLWCVPTKDTLISLCTQEIFGSFVMSVLHVVDDIGSVGIEEEIPLFRLRNDLLSMLLKSFTEYKLGSQQDALLCILPAIIPRLKSSSSQTALDAAKERAKHHRRQRNWTEAEAVLKWAWTMLTARWPILGDNIPDSELSREATISLGELYRYALRDPKARQFGIDGFQWLSTQKSSSGWGLAVSAERIIDRYYAIQQQCLARPQTYVADAVFVAVEKKDVTRTLVELTRQKQPLPPTERIGDALCLAAQQGWPEVVLALLELGANPDYNALDAS